MNAPDGDANQLLLAVRNNDEKQIRALLQAGVDVNTKNSEGESALMFAVENHSNYMLKLLFENKYGSTIDDAASHCLHLLLETGVDVNIRDISGSTPLIRAAQNRDVDCMETLLTAGVDVNRSNERGETALMYSIKEKNIDCLKLLLEEGADVNVQDSIGSTGLIYSAQYGYAKCVKMLLKSGTFVNTANLDGTTALIAAVKQNNGKCTSLLVKAGADLNICDQLQNTPLIYAAQNVDVKSELQLLKAGADVNKQGECQCTALMWAIGKHIILREISPNDMPNGSDSHFTRNEENVHESVSCLLQAGAEVNTQDSFGNTALLYAAKHGCTKCVNMVIKAGADVNIKNKAGDDALGISMKRFATGTLKWRECAFLLITAGANVNGEVLYKVAEVGNVPCVIKCIEAGADVNYEYYTGRNTPLTAAVKNRYGYLYEHGNFNLVVKYLLAAGANVNHSTHSGETALHPACEMGRDKIIELLLSAGADVNPRTNKGDTPLMMVVQHRRITSVHLLLNAGADVNIQGHFQYSTLHLAYNSIESIKILLRAGVMINVMDKYNHNALEHAIAEHGARSICMLLFAAGESTEGSTVNKYDIWDNVKHVPVPKYLQDIIAPELCLKHQCRMTIRKHLISRDPHTHLFTRAPELGLPKPLEAYLLFNISL